MKFKGLGTYRVLAALVRGDEAEALVGEELDLAYNERMGAVGAGESRSSWRYSLDTWRPCWQPESGRWQWGQPWRRLGARL